MPLFSRIPVKLTASTAVGLTEAGKRAAERDLSRGSTFAILSALAEHSPRTIGSISTETQIDVNSVKHQTTMLARQGYVRIIFSEA